MKAKLTVTCNNQTKAYALPEQGVKIGRDTTVRNSIIMQDTVLGEGCYLNCVITDKNVVVRDGRVLSGADSQPYYVAKRKMI